MFYQRDREAAPIFLTIADVSVYIIWQSFHAEMSVSVSSENYLVLEAMNLQIGGKNNLEEKGLICLHLASVE